ncbi:3',5'-bisphosphate nucleotidase [Jimgerdemannia flammicorona]|uniref:3'(2'),5'-bisphosphate nucleotidase n=1 Tax=Jimgerdemannia flammicorona TaxID=994334 RepID=A0A433QP68_9FUNG|nr:3',5'-bisphosphate nucleotidase [Jimgerdemannia flammicorona]
MAAAFAQERAIAIHAVLQASKVCQAVFHKLVVGPTVIKKDKSPVTIADYSAQAVVNTILVEHFPMDPMVAEEDTKDLRGDESKVMRSKVLELANEILAPEGHNLTEEKLLESIDRGNYAGGAKGRTYHSAARISSWPPERRSYFPPLLPLISTGHWTLDPIDGTLGFLRGDQFAVCLALIIDGEVQLGVMGCPNLPVSHLNPEGEKGCLFVAVKNQGAFQRAFTSSTEHRISVSSVHSPHSATFCESVEASHSSHDDAARIAARLGITRDPVRMDSQAKYCTIARGAADIYLRLPVSAEYQEKIWDHASGSLLVTEAGGTVTDVNGQPLNFTVGRVFPRNTGVVATPAGIHAEVLSAVKAVLAENKRD